MSARFEFHKTVQVVPPLVPSSVTSFLKWVFDEHELDYSADIGQLFDIFKEADLQVLAAKRIAPFKVKQWLEYMIRNSAAPPPVLGGKAGTSGGKRWPSGAIIIVGFGLAMGFGGGCRRRIYGRSYRVVFLDRRSGGGGQHAIERTRKYEI